MKVYLEKFGFPTPDMEWNEIMYGSEEFKRTCYNNIYPFKILPEHIRELEFGPITILYGTNGSGKTTMLNVIAERLGINRSAANSAGDTGKGCQTGQTSLCRC